MVNIILFGAPASGKGTLASRIKEIIPNTPHISTGDIFRENIKNNTELGKKAKLFMDQGELVPDDLVIDLVKDRLTKNDVLENGFILDGFPRNLKQCNALEEIISIDKVILLETPDRSILIKRILGRYGCDNCGAIYNKYTLLPKKEGICDECGAEIEFKQRSDDTEEALEKRLDVYEQNAKPIIEYYEKKGLLEKIDTEDTLKLKDEEIKKIIGL